MSIIADDAAPSQTSAFVSKKLGVPVKVERFCVNDETPGDAKEKKPYWKPWYMVPIRIIADAVLVALWCLGKVFGWLWRNNSARRNW